MRLDRIQLTAFRQHASTEIVFPESGMIGFIGPNEGGKSTVLEAAAFALYGSRATRGTKDSLRWNGAPDRTVAEVTLDFTVGDTRYTVHRTEHDAELREVEGPQLAEGIRAVDHEVPELLGMELDEFEATFMCRQKDLDRLQEMGGVDKRRFVLGLMGLGRIDEALEACRARKNELRSELQGMREGLGEREPLAEELEEAEEELSSVESALEELRPRAEATEDALSNARLAVERSREKKERHEELTRVRTEATSQAKQAGEEIERVEAKLATAREAAEEFDDRRNEVADLQDLRQERDVLKEARARAKERRTLESLVETREETLQRLRSVEAEAESMVSEYTEDADPRGTLALEEERLEKATARLEDLADHDKVAALRSRLEPGHDCPVCEQAVETVPDASEAERTLQDAREEVREAKTRVRSARQMVESLQKHEKALQDAREKIVAKEEELAEARQNLAEADVPAFDATRLAQVQGEIERLEAVEEELRGLKTKADRIPELTEERDRWSEKASAAKARELEATEALEELDFDADAHGVLEQKLEERRAAAQEASKKVSAAETRKDAAQQRAERARQQLEAWDERAEAVRDTEQEHQTHVEADERLTAFRAAEARSVRPELEELASGMISVLTDGRHEAVRLTEDFDLRVLESGVEQEVVSGGAEDVSAIALRLAISQLIAERAGHPLSLLVLDEPFGSLDAVRRQNVLELIRGLESVFAQVLLITHVEEVQDAVDHAYRFRYDEAEGMSRVTLEQTAQIEGVA